MRLLLTFIFSILSLIPILSFAAADEYRASRIAVKFGECSVHMVVDEIGSRPLARDRCVGKRDGHVFGLGGEGGPQ
ncbi:MAG: hypothetical protein AAB250_03160, partial [Bdellovibrionota bacterium]